MYRTWPGQLLCYYDVCSAGQSAELPSSGGRSMMPRSVMLLLTIGTCAIQIDGRSVTAVAAGLSAQAVRESLQARHPRKPVIRPGELQFARDAELVELDMPAV